MKIMLARARGMCFGVKDALALAHARARREPVTVLGELVHNPEVVARLAEAGAGQAALEGTEAPTREVIITAHGAADSDRRRWRESGHVVTDATCPLVRRAHDVLAELVRQGCHPVIVGKPGHVEVRGLTRDLGRFTVIDSERDIERIPECPKYGIMSQTTQPALKVRTLLLAVGRRFPDAEIVFRDTVCHPTKERQDALEELCRSVELVIVVGGRDSNNSRQLVETARRLGREAYLVENASQVDPVWFVGVDRVGVTAGTSTLEDTILEVLVRLKQLAIAQRYGMLQGSAR